MQYLTVMTYAVSKSYAHSDDQSIKNKIIQGKHIQMKQFGTWGWLRSHEYPSVSSNLEFYAQILYIKLYVSIPLLKSCYSCTITLYLHLAQERDLVKLKQNSALSRDLRYVHYNHSWLNIKSMHLNLFLPLVPKDIHALNTTKKISS